jgi:DNA processing protein
VLDPIHLTALDPAYPTRLRGSCDSPPDLSTQGGSLEAERVVAVVGSREAHRAAVDYAQDLAGAIAATGAVVVSGGARGIDAAAHEAALWAGGRTWVVAGTGCLHAFPPDHKNLFSLIARGPSAMLWPFPPETSTHVRGTFLRRNRVLVALADVVVVVQAGQKSGALNAAGWALRSGKPLWVVAAPPWRPFDKGFEGSQALLEQGARPLRSTEAFLASLRPAVSSRPLSDEESAILAATSSVPLHLDEIASRAHASARAASAALLTLALENVVVEGPPGFFRRRDAPKHMNIAR